MTEHGKELWQRYLKSREKYTEQTEAFAKDGCIQLTSPELNFIAFAIREAVAGVMDGKMQAPDEKAQRLYEEMAVGETILSILAATDISNMETPGALFELRRIDV